jgi:hypothetical protein
MSASDPADRASFDDKDSQALTERLRLLVDIRDRRHGFPPRVYPKRFVGTDAVRALVAENMAADVTDAIRLGNMLLDAGAFHHVLKEHAFKNEGLFYRFAADEDHGAVATTPDGTAVSWADFLASLTGGGPDGDSGSLQAAIPERDPQLGQFRQDDLEARSYA